MSDFTFRDLNPDDGPLDAAFVRRGLDEAEEARRADLFLTVEDFHAMRDLCTPGSHTHSHSVLTALSPEELDDELRLCSAALKEVASPAGLPFAVPFGRRSFLPERVRAAVARHCPLIFSAYGFGNLHGGQLHFRRVSGDDPRVASYADLCAALTRQDANCEYLMEWAGVLTERRRRSTAARQGAAGGKAGA